MRLTPSRISEDSRLPNRFDQGQGFRAPEGLQAFERSGHWRREAGRDFCLTAPKEAPQFRPDAFGMSGL